MQDGMGDTGTTPRGDIGAIMMNRGANPSYDTRPSMGNLVSPFLDQSSRRSILNPMPLRHNNSFMSNGNSILPNFGGGDNS